METHHEQQYQLSTDLARYLSQCGNERGEGNIMEINTSCATIDLKNRTGSSNSLLGMSRFLSQLAVILEKPTEACCL